MRRLNPVLLFLIGYALVIAVCALLSEPTPPTSNFAGWDFQGNYMPMDEELGIVIPDSADEAD